jgi:hypothetical protein
MRQSAVALALGTLLAGACALHPSLMPPSGDAFNESACDPLATHATTLGTVIGVGKDAAGTLYVADTAPLQASAVPTGVRVFVVKSGALVRQNVLGSGGSASEDIETFTSADGSSTPRDLTMVVAGGKATSMSLGPESSGKLGLEGIDAGAATPLTLVDASAVQGLPAIDLPAAVSYVADGADGNAIVVTAPLDNDEGSAASHLFYGAPNAMVERPVISVEQSKSGYPTFRFAVGSQTYVMTIPSVPSDGGLLDAPGPVTVTPGPGAAVSFTLRQPTPSTLSGFTFTCISGQVTDVSPPGEADTADATSSAPTRATGDCDFGSYSGTFSGTYASYRTATSVPFSVMGSVQLALVQGSPDGTSNCGEGCFPQVCIIDSGVFSGTTGSGLPVTCTLTGLLNMSQSPSLAGGTIDCSYCTHSTNIGACLDYGHFGGTLAATFDPTTSSLVGSWTGEEEPELDNGGPPDGSVISDAGFYVGPGNFGGSGTWTATHEPLKP